MLKSDVMKQFETYQDVADVLGITRSAVQQWGELVPETSAYKLQVITAGRLRVDPSLYLVPKKTDNAEAAA
jgi:hypothetical protein